MSRRRAGVARAAAALTALVLVLVTACTDEPTQPGNIPTGASSVTASGPPSTSEAPQTDEEQIITVWKKWSQFILELDALPDEQVVDQLTPLGGPAAIDGVVSAYQQLRVDGHSFDGEVTFGTFSVTVNGDAAELSECRDTTGEQVVDSATGTVVESGQPGTLIDVSFVRQNGAWLIQEYHAKAPAC